MVRNIEDFFTEKMETPDFFKIMKILWRENFSYRTVLVAHKYILIEKTCMLIETASTNLIILQYTCLLSIAKYIIVKEKNNCPWPWSMLKPMIKLQTDTEAKAKYVAKNEAEVKHKANIKDKSEAKAESKVTVTKVRPGVSNLLTKHLVIIIQC